MNRKPMKALLSFAVTLVVLCAAMPLTASANETEQGKVIQGIERLEERFTLTNPSDSLYFLAAEPKTSQEELRLPKVLTVIVEKKEAVEAPEKEEQNGGNTVSENTLSGNQVVQEKQEDTETVTSKTEKEMVSVSWTSDTEYRPDEAGTYLFTPELPQGYTLAEGVRLPQISITTDRQLRRAVPFSTERTKTLDFTGVGYQTEAGVTQNPSGVYTNETEGWCYDENTNTLTLSGLNLVTDDIIGLSVSGNCTIELVDGSTNSITSNYQLSGSEITSVGIKAEKLTVKGNSGTLNVRGGGGTNSYGVLCDAIEMEGGTLKAEGGTVPSNMLNSIGLFYTQDSIVRGGSLAAVGGTSGDDASSMGIAGSFDTDPDLTISGGSLSGYSVNQNEWCSFIIGIRGAGDVIVEGGTVYGAGEDALMSTIGIMAQSVIVTGGTVTAKCGSISWDIGSAYAVGGINDIKIGSNMEMYTGSDYKTPAYFGIFNGRVIIATQEGGSISGNPIRIAAKIPPVSNNSPSTKVQSPSAPAEPELASVNYKGAELKSWMAIQKALENLSAANLKDDPTQAGTVKPVILEVNIQNTAGFLSRDVVKGLIGKENVGLHLFLGNGVAVTFLGQNLDQNFKGTDLSNKRNKIEKDGKKEYIIDFKEKGEIGAVLLLHASIPDGAKSKAAVYKEDKAGNRTLVLNTVISENGALCFAIDAKERYVIEY